MKIKKTKKFKNGYRYMANRAKEMIIARMWASSFLCKILTIGMFLTFKDSLLVLLFSLICVAFMDAQYLRVERIVRGAESNWFSVIKSFSMAFYAPFVIYLISKVW